MYQRYFEAFPKVWTASAFKGMCFKPTLSSTETKKTKQIETQHNESSISCNRPDIYL